MQSRIRVKLVIGSSIGPAWWDSAIRSIISSPDAEVGSSCFTHEPQPPLRSPISRLILRFYRWVDERVFARANDPTELVDLSRSLKEIPGGDSIDPDAPPDLIVLFGVSSEGPWGPPVRFGFWRFEHAIDGSAMAAPLRGAMPPGGQELLLGIPSTTTRLVATHAGVEGFTVLGRVTSRVDRLSVSRGSRGHLRKLPPLLARALHDLRIDGSLPDSVDDEDDWVSTSPDVGAASISISLFRVVASFIARWLQRIVAPTRWVVGVSRVTLSTDAPVAEIGQPRLLKAPRGRQWTDPFPVALVDREILFVEEYVDSVGRGRIAVVELDDSARGWRSSETVLDLPTHLSYPFVFRWNSDWYLLPEQASTRSLQLYRADSFPTGWAWHSTMLPGIPASDPTLVEIEGRWWLFVAIAISGGNAADELHLFHAETPLGPWTAHHRNPVVSDVRTARPAGRIYQRNGRWYRPAQNGELAYGHSMAILEIEEISEDRYQERAVATIAPTWAPGIVATHTLNRDGVVTAIDALRREPRIRFRRDPS